MTMLKDSQANYYHYDYTFTCLVATPVKQLQRQLPAR